MALFSRTKKADVVETTGAKAVTMARSIDRDLSSVIVAPVITEKAVLKHDSKAYTFYVRKDATKFDVMAAMKAYYNVTPVKVNIVNKAPRAELSGTRGRLIKQPGYKKAYVYLKAGDSISIA